MNAKAISVSYGAFEIKRAYRKNLVSGIAVSTAICIMIAVSFIFYLKLQPTISGRATGTIPPIGQITLSPRPVAPYDIPNRTIPADNSIISNGIPVPVPDEDAPDNVIMPTQEDLGKLADRHAQINFDDFDNVAVVVQNPEDILPRPDTFIPCDEFPQAIEMIQPEYPEMARQAGVQGDVWVKALIDKEGRVRDVIIEKASGAHAGFEDAAIAAAKATSWKPALSNGQPVAIWISYKVSFKLK
jgi:periplasmic protein TonB